MRPRSMCDIVNCILNHYPTIIGNWPRTKDGLYLNRFMVVRRYDDDEVMIIFKPYYNNNYKVIETADMLLTACEHCRRPVYSLWSITVENGDLILKFAPQGRHKQNLDPPYPAYI
jgi:hypothetical protein